MKIITTPQPAKRVPWTAVLPGEVVRLCHGDVPAAGDNNVYMKLKTGEAVALADACVCSNEVMDSKPYTFIILDAELVVK